MSDNSAIIREEVRAVLEDLVESMPLSSRHLLVIGVSTSEVIGEKIGTSGTDEIAEAIYKEAAAFREKTGVQLAFQCCEHLNRALVVERETAEQRGYEEVSVIPMRSAGGSMATYAYHHFKEPAVVEFIKADAGIDIGDTFIGMHLKHVAVPVRSRVKKVGEAHVTLAKTRPKLIGGERAVYPNKEFHCF
ncbi:TIGR01440 family protein [Bacillus taeanensis]|uniref:UPF0340 protein DS031_15290 n=1 Tax=Bacillus taeanensis TaxID=273032 RepID=A0A366XSR2_9BACI|nr:TIGR01440 family protein [Bacillus taeanensis]RBW68716.1 TIGR01440 family protein [Bacillus taeanensis]